MKDQDASWFNLYRRQQIFRSETAYDYFSQKYMMELGYKLDKDGITYYKDEIPYKEFKKLEKYKKLIVYDDETGKILTDSEINELDEFRNCSLYPNTIVVQENPKQPQTYEPVTVIKKKRGKKLRLPLSDVRRKEVLEIREYRCSVCGYMSKSNQIHHIDEDPSNNELENLDLLCYECHKKMHCKEV